MDLGALSLGQCPGLKARQPFGLLWWWASTMTAIPACLVLADGSARPAYSDDGSQLADGVVDHLVSPVCESALSVAI